MVNTHPKIEELKQRLRSSVARMYQYKQGTTIYGVRSFNTHSKDGAWSSSGKIYTSLEQAESNFYNTNLLRNPDIHDTVLYSGEVSIIDNQSKDTFIISSDEEIEIILTNIEVIDRRKAGESL